MANFTSSNEKSHSMQQAKKPRLSLQLIVHKKHIKTTGDSRKHELVQHTECK